MLFNKIDEVTVNYTKNIKKMIKEISDLKS